MMSSTNSQSSFQDIANIFPRSKDDLIKDLKYSKVLGVPFLRLIDQCMDDVFRANYTSSLSCCDILLDMSWEKLNTGYWKDVHLDWRRVYTVVSVIKVFCQCCILKNKQESESTVVGNKENTSEDCKDSTLLADDTITMLPDDKNKMLLAEDKNKMLPDDTNKMLLGEDKNKMLADDTNKMLLGEDKNKLLSDDTNKMLLGEDKNKMLPDDTNKMLLAKDKNQMLPDDTNKMLLAEDENQIVPDDTNKMLLGEDKNKMLLGEDKNKMLADDTHKMLLGENKNKMLSDERTKMLVAHENKSRSESNRNNSLEEETADTSLTDTISVGDILKSCDMGLLMGAPILDNILTKLSTKIYTVFGKPRKRTLTNNDDEYDNPDKKKGKTLLEYDTKTNVDTQNKRDVTDQSNQVERIYCPSLERFKNKFMDSKTPVIITDAIDFWPALGERKWTLDYLKETAGYRTVPIELGSKYTEESWTQDLLTVKDFIEKYIEHPESSTIGYLAQHQLFDQIPELQNDIVIPTYCCLGDSDDVETNAWFGPKGTVSPLHYDAKHNLLAQTVGQKYIRLYSNEYADSLYPHPDRLLFNTSQVDVEMPDLKKFPLFGEVPYTECVLRTGEMLYIPPKYWHFVRSLSISFSISFWWE